MSLLSQGPNPTVLAKSRASPTNPTSRFKQSLDQVASETEHLLGRLLAAQPFVGETQRPTRLLDAMRHASLGGGKRMRPSLVVETSRLFSVPAAPGPDGRGRARMRALLLAGAIG